ncbi:MAG TPA: hypothetical protein VFC51_11970 [Chloroflexota bacterium]|nr:hypothetical protein [Chloroflexota bacterium]
MRVAPRRLPVIRIGALGALVALVLAGIHIYRASASGALVDEHGSGPGGQTTEVFTVHGAWDLHWSYDCSGASNGFQKVGQCDFRLAVKRLSDCQVSAENQGVTEHGVKGQGVVHNHTPGTYYVVVDSDGRWAFTVTGSGRGWGEGPAAHCSDG